MKNVVLFFTFIFLFLFSISAFAQTASPTPPEQDEGDVVKISTNLIQIDVTVTDKKGNVVTDLKPEDIEIFENGQKQDITNFSFIPLVSERRLPEPTKTDSSDKNKNSVQVPPVKLKPEQVRRTYAIVVDDFSLSLENAYWVKNALRKFINEQMKDGDLVAIIRTGGGTGVLQSFTSDKRLLLAAATKVRWSPLNDKTEPFEPIRTTDIPRGDPVTRELIREMTGDFLKNVQEFRSDTASFGTLGALRTVINGMKDLPGRKSVIVLSEGFNLYNSSGGGKLLSNRAGQGKVLSPQVFQQLRVLIDLANRESITFYPIDPRGLDAPAATGADDTTDIPIDNFDSSNDPIGDIARDRQNLFRDSQDSLRYLARETGGVAYVNQNKINDGMQEALDDQSGYYLIGYQPDEATFNPKENRFNKLVIKLKRPDLRVRYRSGFFGVTDEKVREASQNPKQQLIAALNSPFGATGIRVDLYSIFVNDESSKNSIRSFLHIDTKDIKLTKSNGFYRGNYEFIAAAYSDNGILLEQTLKNYKFQFDERLYKRFLEQGFDYDVNLPVKKPGAYQLRVAVRDIDSGKVGSASQFVEIPDISKKNLTLSNLIVKNYSLTEWKKLSAKKSTDADDVNFFSDTTLRRFKRGTMLAYSYIIFNAKPDSMQKPQLQIQTRLFRDGKLLLESNPAPLRLQEQTDSRRIEISDAITLGTDLQAGDYALQLIISDNSAKEKRNTASQSIDFEIVN